MKKIFLLTCGLLLTIFIPLAQVSASQEKTEIATLMAQIKILQEKLALLQNAERNNGVNCINLNHNLYLGSIDKNTNNEVSALQRFLARDRTIYPEAEITGYFGPKTKLALEKWQSKYTSLTSNNNPFDYGQVSGKSRFLMQCQLPSNPQTQSEVIEMSLTPQTITHDKDSVLTWKITDPNVKNCSLYSKKISGGIYATEKNIATVGKKILKAPHIRSTVFEIICKKNGDEIKKQITLNLWAEILFAPISNATDVLDFDIPSGYVINPYKPIELSGHFADPESAPFDIVFIDVTYSGDYENWQKMSVLKNNKKYKSVFLKISEEDISEEDESWSIKSKVILPVGIYNVFVYNSQHTLIGKGQSMSTIDPKFN